MSFACPALLMGITQVEGTGTFSLLIKPQYTFLTFGMFLLFLAVVYTYTGKAYIRFHGWVYRADEPKRYWLEVATYYLGGIVFIGLFLYRAHAF